MLQPSVRLLLIVLLAVPQVGQSIEWAETHRRAPLSLVFQSEGMAVVGVWEHTGIAGDVDWEMRRRAPLRGQTDPLPIIRRLPELYAAGDDDEIIELINALVQDASNEPAWQLLPAVTYWFLSNERQNKEIKYEHTVQQLINRVSKKGHGESWLSIKSLPHDLHPLAQLGLATFEFMLASGFLTEKEYLTVESIVARAVPQLPDVEEMRALPNGPVLLHERYVIEGLLEMVASKSHDDQWVATRDRKHIYAMIKHARRWVTAREVGKNNLGGAAYLTLAWGYMLLRELKVDNAPALSSIEDLLDKAKPQLRDEDKAQYVFLQGLMANLNGEPAEALQLLREARDIKATDQILRPLARLAFQLGHLEEAAAASAAINKKDTLETYEEGRIHFSLAQQDAEGDAKRGEHFQKAFDIWSGLRANHQREVLSSYDLLKAFDMDYLSLCVRLGKWKMGFPAAADVLRHEGSSLQALFLTVERHQAPGSENSRIFLKQLAPRLKSADREEALKRAGATHQGTNGAEKELSAPEKVIADWRSYKTKPNVRIEEIANLFSSGRWRRQPTAWRMAQIRIWLETWWQWPIAPEADKKIVAPRSGEPPMAKRGDVLNALVVELRRMLDEETRRALAGETDPLDDKAMANLLTAFKPWTAQSGTPEFRRVKPLYVQYQTLEKSITGAVEQLQDLRITAAQEQPAPDAVAEISPPALIPARMLDQTIDASKCVAQVFINYAWEILEDYFKGEYTPETLPPPIVLAISAGATAEEVVRLCGLDAGYDFFQLVRSGGQEGQFTVLGRTEKVIPGESLILRFAA